MTYKLHREVVDGRVARLSLGVKAVRIIEMIPFES